jgi:hypothetical protein
VQDTVPLKLAQTIAVYRGVFTTKLQRSVVCLQTSNILTQKQSVYVILRDSPTSSRRDDRQHSRLDFRRHSLLRRDSGVESMKYYVQYKRFADPFYRTYGSLNSAREVMDVLRAGRQLDSKLHYIWARYQTAPDIVTNPKRQTLPSTVRPPGPEIT